MAAKVKEIFVYDIETTPLKFWGFATGNQFLSHNNLDKGYYTYDIICISYRYSSDKKAKVLHWGHGAQSSQDMVLKFDKIIKKVQDSNVVIFGKNNKKFDDKHINTHRWLHDHPAMPDWIKYTDDLETQLRRNFYLPSYSLDFASELKGLGGKIPMTMKHWVNCVQYKRARILIDAIGYEHADIVCKLEFKRDLKEVLKTGRKALNEMCEYNQKDVDDTTFLILDVAKHCEFKSNIFQPKYGCCKDPLCGSTNIHKNGVRVHGGLVYQIFQCKDHHGYAGKARLLKDGTLGKIH